MAKNLMGKTVKPENAYEVWQDPRMGWTWRVLKFYKSQEATLADEWGRVFCEVDGFEKEMGDVYYTEVRAGSQLIETNYPQGVDRPLDY